MCFLQLFFFMSFVILTPDRNLGSGQELVAAWMAPDQRSWFQTEGKINLSFFFIHILRATGNDWKQTEVCCMQTRPRDARSRQQQSMSSSPAGPPGGGGGVGANMQARNGALKPMRLYMYVFSDILTKDKYVFSYSAGVSENFCCCCFETVCYNAAKIEERTSSGTGGVRSDVGHRGTSWSKTNKPTNQAWNRPSIIQWRCGSTSVMKNMCLYITHLYSLM